MPAYLDPNTKKWLCKFRYKDWTGKTLYKTKRGFKLKKEALAFENDFKAQAQHNPTLTLDSLVSKYLEDYKLNHKESSYRAVKRTMDTKILHVFGTFPINDITSYQVKEWQNEVKKSGAAEASIRTYNMMFRSVFRWAMKYYGLPKNPFDSIGIEGKPSKSIDFWELEEFKRFDAAADNPVYRVIFNILFYSGMRIGELMALEPEDFDFDTCTIHISKQYNDDFETVTSPKTTAGIRTVTMPPSIMAMVQDVFERFYDLPRPRPFGYFTRKGIAFVMKRYAEKAGLRHIKIHDLRHSHASMLLKQGVNVTAVSKRLGHSSPATTLRVYAHVYKGEDAAIAFMLDDVVTNQPKIKKEKNCGQNGVSGAK